MFKPNTRYEVETPTGFQAFSGMRTVSKTKYMHIVFDDGGTTRCSQDHRFIIDGKEVFAQDITPHTVLGSRVVVECYEESAPIELYDLVGVDGGSLFVADGVVNHNCDFIASGNTVIDGPLIQWFENEYVQDPIEKRGPGGDLWIWEPPDYSRDYMVVVDVARGDSTDYSAYHVVDVELCKQVAEFRGHISTKDLGHMVVNIATEYNNALLVIENANVGWAAIQPAIDRGYPNLYYTYKHEGVTDAYVQLQKGYDMKDKSQMTPGFTTSARTRPLLISKLDIYTREKSCIVRSKRLIDEWYVFIWKGNKPEAQRGYNDDLTMSWSIGLYVRDYALKLRNDGIELNRQSLTGFTKTGQGGVYNSKGAQQNNWNMQIGNSNEDLTWLL